MNTDSLQAHRATVTVDLGERSCREDAETNASEERFFHSRRCGLVVLIRPHGIILRLRFCLKNRSRRRCGHNIRKSRNERRRRQSGSG